MLSLRLCAMADVQAGGMYDPAKTQTGMLSSKQQMGPLSLQ